MKTIVISHQKGGVGKSTIAYNIAKNLADTTTVSLIDFDPQGSLSKIAGATELNIHVLQNPKDLKEINSDFVIIDTPPYLSNFLPQLYVTADIILVPTKAGVLDLFAIEDTLTLIKESNSENKTMILFNMVKPNTTITADIKEKIDEFNIKVCKTMIADRVIFTKSILTDGVTADNKAQKEIDDLTKEVLTTLI